MEKGTIKVLGIQRREKDGNVSYTIHGYTPFEDWENGEGYKVISEWTRADLSEVRPGLIVLPIYGKGYQGKAVLMDVHVLPVK